MRGALLVVHICCYGNQDLRSYLLLHPHAGVVFTDWPADIPRTHGTVKPILRTVLPLFLLPSSAGLCVLISISWGKLVLFRPPIVPPFTRQKRKFCVHLGPPELCIRRGEELRSNYLHRLIPGQFQGRPDRLPPLLTL